MISFSEFHKDTLALFFPGPNDCYIAFNFNNPYNILDVYSLSEHSRQTLSEKPFIVGQIVNIK